MAKVIQKRHKIKVSLSRRIFLVCNSAFLITFAVVCLLPFFNLLAISLSDAAAVDAGEVTFIPKGFNLSAYIYLLEQKAFWQSFGLSVMRVILGTAISLIINVLAAYPLSKPKKDLKGRMFYVAIFVITMFFNGGLIPNYLLITTLHLKNTIWSLVLPTALNAWNMVLLINFFKDVPSELIEAAEMDGASQFQILFKVMLPISLPALATVTLFTVVAHWNNWFDGSIYYTSGNTVPLQTYIYQMIDDIKYLSLSNNPADKDLLAQMPDQSLRSAQIFIAMIPIMMVYPFVQKYFIKGLTQGGVKE
jgi:putative aldouronate transport system permease protein